MTRPTWDAYFLQLAAMAAARSTCDRANVGAVLVRDRRILATGYNGSPSGMAHCDEAGHWMVDGHCVRTIHAEQNAILQCAITGVSTVGATLYCTHNPCRHCAKLLVQAGVIRIVYAADYADEVRDEFLQETGIETEVIER